MSATSDFLDCSVSLTIGTAQYIHNLAHLIALVWQHLDAEEAPRLAYQGLLTALMWVNFGFLAFEYGSEGE